jgi:hypothetical protein
MNSGIRAGRIIGESFKLVFRHIVTIGTIGLLCCLPMLVVLDRSFAVAQKQREAMLRGEQQGRAENDPMITFASLSMYVTYPLACGAIAFAVYQSMRGRRVSFFESFGAALKRVFGLFGLLICSLLFIGVGFAPAILFTALGSTSLPGPLLVLGFVLLLIPGFALVTMVYVANPVLIVENKGVFASMRRSRELTAGHRPRIFVVLVGVFALCYLIALVAGVGMFMSQLSGAASTIDRVEVGKTMTMVISAVWVTFFLAWTAAAAGVAYGHLTNLKDSTKVEDVGDVFD